MSAPNAFSKSPLQTSIDELAAKVTATCSYIDSLKAQNAELVAALRDLVGDLDSYGIAAQFSNTAGSLDGSISVARAALAGVKS